jgi:hypothetical protein
MAFSSDAANIPMIISLKLHINNIILYCLSAVLFLKVKNYDMLCWAKLAIIRLNVKKLEKGMLLLQLFFIFVVFSLWWLL